MLRRTVQSSNKPTALVEGADTVLIRTDIHQIDMVGEDGGTYKMWEYDEISLSLDEANNVKNHILPYNAVWTDGLRSYERRALYDEADRMKTKASEMGNMELVSAIVTYKTTIRNSQGQETYPEIVEYPAVPWE